MDENAFNSYMSKLGNQQTTPTGQSSYPIKPLAIMSPSMSNASIMHQNYHTPIGSQSQSMSSDVEYLGLKPTAPATTAPPNQQLAAAAFAFYTSLFNQQQNTAALNLFHQAYNENNNAENKNDASFNPTYHFPDSSSSNHRIMNEKYIYILTE
jgi:hypothetical protein